MRRNWRGLGASAQTPNGATRFAATSLHPYKSVKDHRTNLQSTNPDGVLAGDIDQFIEAYLVHKLGNGE